MNLEVLKALANENVSAIFDAFNLEYYDRYNYYQGPCPIHKGDNDTAFSWHKSGGYFRCFTRKCETGGADIFDFVQKYKRCSFTKAKSIVESIIIGGSYTEADEEELIAEVAFKRYIKNNLKPIKNFQVFNPEILEKLKPDTYLTNRGFSTEVINEYKIGYCDNPKSDYYGRTCVPIFHHNGSLVGFTARTVHNDWEARREAKWFHTPGLLKGQMLFNLNKAMSHIRDSHSAILVEGPLDILKFWMAEIYNTVAVLGSDLSGPQRSLLLQNECYDLILAFDNDIAGIESTNKTIKTCKPYFNLYRMILPKNKDIGDLSVEEVKKLDIIRV